MKIYKTTNNAYSVQKEELSDRTRYFIVDSDGNSLNEDGDYKGKLVVQNNLSDTHYILTAFRISNPNDRSKGLGSLLMNEFKADPRWMDKPVLVYPHPYEDDNSGYEGFLRNMYSRFGFVPYQGYSMVLEKRTGKK